MNELHGIVGDKRKMIEYSALNIYSQKFQWLNRRAGHCPDYSFLFYLNMKREIGMLMFLNMG